jgi:hypothetical protein
VFEGDGGVYIKNTGGRRRIEVCFFGNRGFNEGIRKWLTQWGIKSCIWKKKNITCLSFKSEKAAQIFSSRIYESAVIYMTRKRAVFEEFFNV